jgi:hypothetical protein
LSATTTPPPTGPIPAKADTFLVSCIDPRLTDDTTFHFAALGRTDRYSEMRIAGAALALVDSNRPNWQSTVWENLREPLGVKAFFDLFVFFFTGTCLCKSISQSQ